MHSDPVKVLAFVKDRIQKDVRANTARRSRDRADLQGLQMYRGGEDNHWTVWDPDQQTYVPRPTGADDEASLPPWFFRATNNLFATKTDGICSILNQSQPAQEIGPQRNTDKDRATAEIAEEALPRLYDECDYPALRAQIHKLIALTNGVAVVVDYDTDERHGMDDLPLAQCQACQQFFLPHEIQQGESGADPSEDEATSPTTDATGSVEGLGLPPAAGGTCPDCGGPAGPAFYPMGAGPQMAGQPVTTQFPKGKLALRVLSSFEFSLPRSARVMNSKHVPWIAAHQRMDPTEVARIWPDSRGLLDPESRQKSSSANQQSTQYADRMHAMSSPMATGDRRAGVTGSTSNPTGPVIWMVWADPVDDEDFYFPEGLYAVVLDEANVLEAGALPFKDDNGRPFKNVILRSFQATPGSAWGKPPGDDMVPLQKQLNLCVALAFLILMNDAAPTTFIPDTVTLLDELSGSPGSTVRFKSIRQGDKPIINNGTGFPESLKWFIEWIVGQFDTVSKLNAVLMGDRPQGGDPTAFEVQTLQERGMAAFKEPLNELVEFEKQLSLMLLHVARQSMWSPRFHTVAGDNGEWQVNQFLGADLEGNVTINVEPASAWPQSLLLQNMRLDQAIQRGIINPQDPEVQSTYLSLNNLTAFKASVDEDRAQVARQLDGWRQAQDPSQIEQPDPLWNLPFHFFRKVQFLKTEEAERIKAQQPAVYAAIRQHVAMIQMLMQPAAPPAPGPGQPGGPPPSGQAVTHAVAAGAIHPTQPAQRPSGAAVTHAVAAGAITPAPGAPAAGAVH